MIIIFFFHFILFLSISVLEINHSQVRRTRHGNFSIENGGLGTDLVCLIGMAGLCAGQGGGLGSLGSRKKERIL